jgi:hypothetical protein
MMNSTTNIATKRMANSTANIATKRVANSTAIDFQKNKFKTANG